MWPNMFSVFTPKIHRDPKIGKLQPDPKRKKKLKQDSCSSNSHTLWILFTVPKVCNSSRPKILLAQLLNFLQGTLQTHVPILVVTNERMYGYQTLIYLDLGEVWGVPFMKESHLSQNDCMVGASYIMKRQAALLRSFTTQDSEWRASIKGKNMEK